jgi:putative flippase GtrA
MALIIPIQNFLKRLLGHEFTRFLIVGSITVSIDLICYFIMVYVGLETPLAKGISFSIGTVFAYFANRSYTFQSVFGGFILFIVFVTLYLSTLSINVISNEIVLKLTNEIYGSIMIAFIIATSLSATLNFIGMKYLVFNKNRN